MGQQEPPNTGGFSVPPIAGELKSQHSQKQGDAINPAQAVPDGEGGLSPKTQESEGKSGPGITFAAVLFAYVFGTGFRIAVSGRLSKRMRELHRERRIIRDSRLFDISWYRKQNPQARPKGVDPVLDYLVRGAREGADPNPFFSTQWYLKKNPDVAAAKKNPLVHFITAGAAEGRNPHPLFDCKWYLAKYPDVAALKSNPLRHYLRHGVAEGRITSPKLQRAARKSGRWCGSGTTKNAPVPERRPEGRQRVVFISGEPNTPGHTYRVEMHADALWRSGADVHVFELCECELNQDVIQEAHVVLLWRVAWSPEVAEVLLIARAGGAKIVFDVDDLMIDPKLAKAEFIDGIRSQGFEEDAIAKMYTAVQRTMLEADFCITTTKPLASAMRRHQKATFVLPNGFDEFRYERSRLAVAERRQNRGDGLIRLGYAGGSRTHQKDFACAAPAVARILREHPEARLVLFYLEVPTGKLRCLDSHEFQDLDGLENQIEWRPFVPANDLPFEMARFDINLAPLETGNPFCEAKSELKYFEAALVDVPTVASPTLPYAEAIQHGTSGFLATTSGEWYDALKRLVTEPGLRKKIGRASCLQVLWRSGPERRAELSHGILRQIIASEGQEAASLFESELRRGGGTLERPPECSEHEIIFESGMSAHCSVAVVVPLFNYAAYVEEALESVKTQTLARKGLVVVEDCSTDDSLRIAERWMRENARHFTHVALLKNRKNSGLPLTRNTGFAFADARFILPLDADNVLLPECLDQCLETIERAGASAAFMTIQEFGDSHGTRSCIPWNPARFAGGNFVDAMALFRRAAWAGAGGYQRMTVPGWEDYELWCRFVERGLWCVSISKVLARYRVHARSMLQTATDLAESRSRLAAEMKALHPWLDEQVLAVAPSAPGQPASNPPPPAAPEEKVHAPTRKTDPNPGGISKSPDDPKSLPRPRDRARLDELLALMRCPLTGQPLRIDSENRLLTADGSREWPLVGSRPVFFGTAAETRQFPDTHLSNRVPARALRMIESLTGPVLNISAGGTHTWLPNLVELETAIFRNTDIVGDGHALPFADGVFEAVMAINAFEHYREPDRVAAEILRVLKPGGRVFIQTAFLQPLHEPPWHFFNCTKFGLLQWFGQFETVDLCVSDNFNPIYAISWQVDELLKLLQSERGASAADRFASLPLGDIAAFWNNAACRDDMRWADLRKLSQAAQERLAAGFEFIGRKRTPDAAAQP